ncbi:molybdopterin-dependent oxidoreductase [Amycolatopsis sp. 195334CR]|uniref:molybdopterin-dependent oxidoreductase n=1 Tax=Amycolatopsis sp. 195334CR TaxID=2814588 RepID=UPI001A8E03EB|nr:molybdopterin-dependent oxidoreductase [Amycolatopsis sp. 195334CR]MBN6036001.1 molybdopterin-dependent oxidoreductase [Amycolatopsis sp. 195334CR]
MSVLPPGQRPAARQRFGLPEFARVRPEVPARPVVTVTGVVRRPVQLDLAELLGEPRREQVADLHCVTTWSALSLRWGGVPFRQVHEFLSRRVAPHPKCRWVVFAGLDGFRACLALEDALADDVLLADSLAGQPLDADAGAPLRLVAPAHYGYKGVRHVCAIEYRTRYDQGSARWKAHRRGRVELEERSALLPGRIWRPLWRRFAPVGTSTATKD